MKIADYVYVLDLEKVQVGSREAFEGKLGRLCEVGLFLRRRRGEHYSALGVERSRKPIS